MVKIYATACEKDGKNFFTVPKSLQAKVKAQIEADGYVILEDGTVVKEMPLEEEQFVNCKVIEDKVLLHESNSDGII